jgi:hypothetical protein
MMKISASLFMNDNYKVYDADIEMLSRIVSSKCHYSNIVWATGKRLSANYQPQSDCIILDYDEVVTIEQALEWFKDYEKMICTTKSHQIEKNGIVCDRFRVIIPTDSVIDLDRNGFVVLMKYLTQRLGADQQATDAGRKYLASEGCKIITTGGKRLDWKYYYGFALSKERERKERFEANRKKYDDNSNTILNPETWLRAFKPETIGTGERNSRLAKIAFWLKDKGASCDLVLSALQFVNNNISIPLKDREIEYIAKTKFR